MLLLAVVLQGAFAYLSRRASGVLGERVFAELREGFVDRAVDLPLSTVETAGTGDLVSRTTNDVETLSWTVRLAVPTVFVAGTACVLTLVATVAAGPLVALALVVGVPLVVPVTRWYLRRSRRGYLAERDAYGRVNGGITETVESATTVEHLGLGPVRVARTDADLRRCWAVERYTLALRTRLFPLIDTGYQLPMVAALLWGGFLVSQDLATLGQVTAVTLYLRLLVDPLDELLAWIDQLQVGAACYARVIGVGLVPDDRTATDARAGRHRGAVRGARYAYGTTPDGAPLDVLHDVDLDLRAGERLAVVGPSGAGKSTLGRLLAGVHPPRTGRVDVGGVPLVDLPLPELRRRVALVTQEHHVFVGTLADNLLLARADADRSACEAALGAVDALGWAAAAAAGPGHRGGLGGPGPHPRPGAAAGPGTARARRPPHPGAGRGHLAAGPAGRPAPGAVAVGGADRPDRGGHRPPAAHRPRRRPGGRGRGRPGQRARQPRGAPGSRRVLRGPVALVAGGARAGHRAVTSSA